MSRWWRAYDEAVDDPKLILLTDRQHRVWFNLCCINSKNGGTLPTLAVIAVQLRMKPDKAKHAVAELVALGLVDAIEGGFAMHNWNARQFKSDVSTERVQALRKRRRNVSPAVSETPPETEEQKTERYSELRSAPVCVIEPPEPVDEDPKAKLFRIGKTTLVSFGIAEKRTGALIGQWLKTRNDPIGLLAAIQYAREQNIAEPIAYISAAVNAKEPRNGQHRQSLSDIAHDLADEARRIEREAGLFGPNDAVRGH
jgi:hypothetical protein